MVVTEKNNSLKIVVCLMVGVIFSGMVSVMYLSGSVNLQKFYDVGAIYDIISTDYERTAENWQYNYSTKLIEITADTGIHPFQIRSQRKNWNYLYMEVKNLSSPIHCQVEFCDSGGNVLYTMDCELQEGRNVLSLQEEKIFGFNLVVQGPSSFHIKRLQFREHAQTFGWGEALMAFGVLFGCWVFVLLFILFLFRREEMNTIWRRTGWIEKLQEAYSCLLSNASGLRGGISPQKIPYIRRALFFVSLLIIYIMFVTGWRLQALPQRRLVLLLGVCILLVAFLSGNPKRRAVNWKNPLMYAWFVLWIMCIISEFVVEKRIQNVGIFMLGCMGPFYLAWGAMKKPDYLLKDFLIAMRWSYWASCFFCLFFRPAVAGIRYMGIYQNPNSFAGYLVTVNIAFLIWLDENLNKEKLKFGALCQNVLALTSLCGFLLLTESITSFVVYLAEWIVFVWKQFPNEKPQNYQKNLRIFVLTFFAAIAITWIPGKLCLDHLPNVLKTKITLEGDAYVTQGPPLTMVVNASGEPKIGVAGRVLSKIRSGDWDSLFSSRTEIWKEYFRQMNLFGHYAYLESLNGKAMHAHNALLQMMSYYGVFTVVPYIIILYYSVKYGILAIFERKRSGISLFFLMAAVNYIIQGLTEDMATPFFYISWLTFFIALGGIAHQPAGRNVRR